MQQFALKIHGKCAMVLHVDDVLFLGDQQWITNVFLPKLKEEFKLSSTVVDWETGGTFEFLKRFHVIEPQYKELTVFPEEKHTHAMFEKYTKANGKAPKLCKTPSSNISNSLDPSLQTPLNEEMSSIFRSLVGIAMYVSQERFDLQYTTKSLASHLKSPTKEAWINLGRLIGYMKFSEHFALKMVKTSKGSSFQNVKFGGETETGNNLIETYSDSDWSNRSTSAAIHVLNGNVIWSTSRTQKCISLSSTEAEWYSATSAVCDALFLHYVVTFLTEDTSEAVVLHTDNSAVKMLSKKLGAGRLRHIRGRLLWLQSKVLSAELCIKQVRTLYNVADLNTKSLAKDRHLFLLHMLGFVSEGESVGETEFSRVHAQELLKQQVNVVSASFSEQTGQKKRSSTNRMAKQFLRALSVFSVMSLAEGSSVFHVWEWMEVSTKSALSWWCGSSSPMTMVAVLIGFAMVIGILVMMTPGSSRDHERRDRSRSPNDLEPGAEPPTSRYPANPRSLSSKFPNLFTRGNFRPEGVLYWLLWRCSKRALRGNERVKNLQRKGGLVEMLQLCGKGLSEEEHEQMVDNLRSLTDLTDDEFSPRHSYTEEQVIAECDQAEHAFGLAMDEIRRMEAEDADSDGEAVESAEGRYYRYASSTISEISDPAYWYEVHGEVQQEEPEEDPADATTPEEEPESEIEDWEHKKHRYGLIERHEASDAELWDQLHEQAMLEIHSEGFMEGPHVDFREYLEERATSPGNGEGERNEEE